MALYSNVYSVVRQYLSAQVGDLIMGTAASGSSTTIVHTMLRKGDDYYNEHHYRCYIYGGTNIGEEREVSDWVKSTNTLTLEPAYTAAIDNTSTYELHYIFTETEYRKAINMAIESIAGKYLIDLIDDTTITLVADTYEYALPTSFLYLHKITTEADAAGDVFDASDVIDPRDWSIITAYPPTLKLDENRYTIVAGKDLRLEGQGSQAAVSADTDVISLPQDWVVQKAITYLPKNKIQSNQLEGTYQQALLLSANVPIVFPNPRAKRIVE
uniref:Uncharacterized protein n=1 Tax=viral metagenome TaxID=1070528 RepID=A0A6M3L447_9ZZZZ